MLIDKLQPSGNYSVVRRKLEENKEARKVLENSNHIPLEGLFNINSVIDKVEKGMILEPVELIACEDFLRGCRKIKKFMIDKEFYAPTLSSYALNITECEDIEEEISCLQSALDKGHLTKEEFDKKVANEKNTLGLRLIPLYLYPSLPIGITLTSIGGEERVFDGSNIDTDIRFGCIAWGIKPKKD